MTLPDLMLGPRRMYLISAFLVAGLALEQLDPWWGQCLTALLAWLIFAGLYQSMSSRAGQNALIACLALATLGELFCSLLWGLYTYRLGNIPLYVPPGHVLMFVLGASLAPRLPWWIIYAVPLCAAPYVILAWGLGFDQLSLLLFAFFLACLLNGPDRRLFATMFMLALCLEIYGTWLGNWTWDAQVPYWGISATSPPMASGAFYSVLDFLVLILLKPLLAARPSREVAWESSGYMDELAANPSQVV
jgi:hypothetical protein